MEWFCKALTENAVLLIVMRGVEFPPVNNHSHIWASVRNSHVKISIWGFFFYSRETVDDLWKCPFQMQNDLINVKYAKMWNSYTIKQSYCLVVRFCLSTLGGKEADKCVFHMWKCEFQMFCVYGMWKKPSTCGKKKKKLVKFYYLIIKCFNYICQGRCVTRYILSWINCLIKKKDPQIKSTDSSFWDGTRIWSLR